MSVAILIAAVFALPFCSFGVADAATFGGVEYCDLWYYDALNIEAAKQVIATWDLSKVTSPVIIACIDTGINAKHQVFDGVLTRNSEGMLLGYNSFEAVYGGGVDGQVNVTDEMSMHGTKVAGVMAMLIRELGLENYIKIYPIKANTPDNDSFRIDSVINAIEWATSDKVKASVVNMSLSASEKGTTITWKTSETLKYTLVNAARNAVLVAASGNTSAGGLDSETTAFYPAAHDGVLGVMGYDTDKKVYSTSNFGGAYDIVAPERGIYSATSGTQQYTSRDENDSNAFNGTSAAAPFVSVAAALLKLRFIVEGKLTVNDGEQNPSGVAFESMLSNLDAPKIVKGTYNFCSLDLYRVVAQDFSNTDYNYFPPSEIEVAGNGTLGTEEYYDAYVQRADELAPITFLATIKPLGKTNPGLEEIVEWYLKEVKIGEFESTVVSEKMVGNGLRYVFVAPHGGDYEIEARLKYNGVELKSMHKVHVEYLPYLAGEVRVTALGHEHDSVDVAPSTATIYANEKFALTLTGIEYVDQSVEIKWFVNGVQVADGENAYSGTTFEFVPNGAGTYIISAKYGNRAEIGGDYVFTVVVKPTISNPLYISLIAVGGGVVVIGIGAGVAFALVNKKKEEIALKASGKDE